MQYKVLAVSAFAAAAFAAPQQVPASQTEDVISVLSVLQTALPSTLVAEALTNSAAVSSEIASQFAAGQTPTWFSALPSDVKTYLVPAVTDSAALSSITAAAGNATAVNATALSSMIHNSTMISAGQSSILASIQSANSSVVSRASLGTSTVGGTATGSSSDSSATGASGSSSDSDSSSSSSSAGASMPTAIAGMGLAGALGLMGVLAL